MLVLLAGAILVAVVAWSRSRPAPTVDEGMAELGTDGGAWDPDEDEPAPGRPTEARANRPDRDAHAPMAQRPPRPRSARSLGGDGGPPGPNRTPERRVGRLAERVEITPLGSSETQLSPEDVVEVFREARSEIRECMREHGIPRAEFRAARGEARRITFDVDAAGGVLAESIQVDPPMSEGLNECYLRGLGGGRTVAAGGDGARVHVDMPAMGSRRGAEGDDVRGARLRRMLNR
jgi:hypothetical protein